MRIAAAAFLLIAIATLPAFAADPVPEIKRGAGVPQAVGVVHTLRQIPEACARIEGAFTGQAVEPYKFAVVRTSPNCQPRARLLDAAKVKPSEAAGWKFNDLIRVPNATCPSQQAVVRVWRKPVDQTVKLDAQGRSRLYLAEMKQAGETGKMAAIPMFAAEMGVEGETCGP